jgi:outer membrane protein OmpA-like peptidoglycan-associated protein
MEADAIFDRLIGVLIAQGSASRRRLCLAVTISGVLLISVVQCPNALAAWGAGVEATLPANANSTQGVAVSSVSCASAGNCTAVGSYYIGPGNYQGLLLGENADSWATGVQATLPANAGSPQEVTLSSVSCASAGDCIAVGSYEDGSGYAQGLLLTETSGSWATGVEATLPANAGSSPNVSLNSVSCASAGNCTAVGRYIDSSDNAQGLLLTETSGSWATGVETTLPADAGSNSNVYLSSVSCASAGNCTAVGRYLDSSGDAQGLLLTETTGAWATGVQATLPASVNANPNVSLSSVSCASAGNCTAVGRYLDSSGNLQGLLLTETSGSWATGVEATLPADAGSNPNVSLDSVSCAYAGNCTAVGRYEGGGAEAQGLLLSETSGSWTTGVEATLPANATSGPNVSLNSVSCTSVGNCTAIGTDDNASSNEPGLLLTETAGSWATAVEATVPANAEEPASPSLGSVSCAPAENCTAVGGYDDNSDNIQGLLVSSTPANASLSVSAPSSGTAGNPISASSVSATLSAGASPTGSITVTVFGPQSSAPTDCSGGTSVGTASVTGNNIYNPSAGFTPSSAGDYWWYAGYGGDSNNNAAVSTCGGGMAETIVGAASPSLSAGAPSSGTAGTKIDASSVSGVLSGGASPSGTVTFTVFGPQASAPTDCSGGTSVGTASVTDNDTYNPSAGFTPSGAGDYWWYASYGGDSNNNAADSGCGVSMAETVVGAASPSLSVGAPGSGTAGTAVAASNVSAALSGGASPGGTITFKVFGPQASAPTDCSGGTSVGTASVTGNSTYNPSAGFTPSSAGDYWWYASYGGDSNNNAADSTCGASMAETVVGAVSAPTARILSPAGGGTYAVGQSVPTSFSCSEGSGGSGIASCDDTTGHDGTTGVIKGSLTTSARGSHTYTVTAVSKDGLTGTATIRYTVAGAPTVTLTAPANGARYAYGRKVTVLFRCADGVSGPGLVSGTGCRGTFASGSALDTRAVGSHTFTVTATSRDGQRTTDHVTYTVGTAPMPAGRLRLAAHTQLASTRAAIPVSCRLSSGTLARCSVTLVHGRTIIATGTATHTGGAATLTVKAHLTHPGATLLTHGQSTITASGTLTPTTGGTITAHASGTLALTIKEVLTAATTFVANSANLTSHAAASLKALAHKLGHATNVTCTGYTANLGLGTTPEALALGLARANAVCGTLADDGLRARYRTLSGGASNPIASNKTVAGQARNRRVEIVITR